MKRPNKQLVALILFVLILLLGAFWTLRSEYKKRTYIRSFAWSANKHELVAYFKQVDSYDIEAVRIYREKEIKPTNPTQKSRFIEENLAYGLINNGDASIKITLLSYDDQKIEDFQVLAPRDTMKIAFPILNHDLVVRGLYWSIHVHSATGAYLGWREIQLPVTN